MADLFLNKEEQIQEKDLFVQKVEESNINELNQIVEMNTVTQNQRMILGLGTAIDYEKYQELQSLEQLEEYIPEKLSKEEIEMEHLTKAQIKQIEKARKEENKRRKARNKQRQKRNKVIKKNNATIQASNSGVEQRNLERLDARLAGDKSKVELANAVTKLRLSTDAILNSEEYKKYALEQGAPVRQVSEMAKNDDDVYYSELMLALMNNPEQIGASNDPNDPSGLTIERIKELDKIMQMKRYSFWNASHVQTMTFMGYLNQKIETAESEEQKAEYQKIKTGVTNQKLNTASNQMFNVIELSIKKQLENIVLNKNFNATADAVKDLKFVKSTLKHNQEKRDTIPELSTVINNANLEFERDEKFDAFYSEKGANFKEYKKENKANWLKTYGGGFASLEEKMPSSAIELCKEMQRNNGSSVYKLMMRDEEIAIINQVLDKVNAKYPNQEGIPRKVNYAIAYMISTADRIVEAQYSRQFYFDKANSEKYRNEMSHPEMQKRLNKINNEAQLKDFSRHYNTAEQELNG